MMQVVDVSIEGDVMTDQQVTTVRTRAAGQPRVWWRAYLS